MLRVYPFLTVHGFLWHGILLGIALTCRYRKTEEKARFSRVLFLFVCLCLIAEIINTAGYFLHTAGSLPDMFYISPYTKAAQPVFDRIGLRFGRGIEIVVYTGLLSTVSGVLYRIR